MIYSIRHQCLTLTEFIFDIQPTIEWKIFENLLEKMLHLQRLIIRKLSTCNQFSLSNLRITLQKHISHFYFLSIRITTLNTKKVMENNDNSHLVYPRFKYTEIKLGNFQKVYSTIIIRSSIN